MVVERKAPPVAQKGSEKSGGKSGRGEKFFRPSSHVALQAQKDMEMKHRQVKMEAHQLWFLLENPVYDSPINPELQFSRDAITLAKRGKGAPWKPSLMVVLTLGELYETSRGRTKAWGAIKNKRNAFGNTRLHCPITSEFCGNYAQDVEDW